MVALKSCSFDAAVPDYRYDFLFHWAAESCSITKQDVIDSLLQEIWVRRIIYCQMLLSRVVCDTTTLHGCVYSPSVMTATNPTRRFIMGGSLLSFFRLGIFMISSWRYILNCFSSPYLSSTYDWVFWLQDTKRTVLLFYQAFQDQNLKSRVEKSNTSNNKLVAPNKTVKYSFEI